MASTLLLHGGRALADTWTVDPAASTLGFTVQIAGGAVEGGFTTWMAEIVYDPAAPEVGSVVVSIDMASVFIAMPEAAAVIGGADWLAIAQHPVGVFEGAGFRMSPAGHFSLPGTLTLRGHRHAVTLAGTLSIEGAAAEVNLTAPIQRVDHAVGAPDPMVAAEVVVTARIVATRNNGLSKN